MQTAHAMPTRAASRPRARGRLAAIARHWQEYLFISPFFLLFAVFFAYPLIWSFILSFQRWDGIGQPRWIGFDNYAFVLRDPVTRRMFANTLTYLLLLVPLGLLLPLLCGVVLNSPTLRLRGLFRTIFFVPVVTSIVVVGIVWRLMFGTANGWLNGLLAPLGLGPFNWLKDAALAYVPIVSLTLWGTLGFSILIVLGGLQAIDGEIYDAAKVDGATGWATFWQITLPLMRPVMLFLLITSTINVATLFGQPYAVTEGGPANATLTPLLHIYNIGIGSSGAARVGDASALSFLLSAFMLIVVFVQLRLAHRRGEG